MNEGYQVTIPADKQIEAYVKIEQLKKFLDDGVITPEQYEETRQQILKEAQEAELQKQHRQEKTSKALNDTLFIVSICTIAVIVLGGVFLVLVSLFRP